MAIQYRCLRYGCQACFGGDSTFGFSFSFCRGLEFHLGSVVCILVCLVLSFDGVVSAGFALLFGFGFSFRCVLPREGLVLCCFPVLLKDPFLIFNEAFL